MKCNALNQNDQTKQIESDDNFMKNLYELEDRLDNLNLQKKNQRDYNKDNEQIKNMPITLFLKTFKSNYIDIGTTIKLNSSLQIPKLPTIKILNELFNQLPTHQTLQQIVNKATSNNINMTIYDNPTSLDNIDEKRDIKGQITHEMINAFNLGKDCQLQMRKILDSVISSLCDVRLQLLISYAWAHSINNDETIQSETTIKTFLKETEQLYRLLEENNENSTQIISWAKMTKQAQDIYRSTNRTTNKWQEIRHRMAIPLMIEEDVKDAFLNSKSAGDAHLWLHFPDQSSQQVNNIVCEPQLAHVDFGIIFSGIRQRITQQIILHNETDNDINIQIKRHTAIEFDFNITPDQLIVPTKDIAEIDVLFKSPDKFIGQIAETLDFTIDNKLNLNGVIRLRAQIVKVDLEIGSGAIKCEQNDKEFWEVDFSHVPCGTQIQTNDKNYQSSIIIIKNEFIIEGKTTKLLNLKLQPPENNNIDENFEALICLAISPSKNIKWIKAKACIRRPLLSIFYGKVPLIENSKPTGILTISDFYMGEHRTVPFEFKNTGDTDFTLSITSRDLQWKYENIYLQMGKSSTIEIPINIPQEKRTTFSINIKFLNIKRCCTLQLICETLTPLLDIPTIIKKTIKISQSADLQALYDSYARCLNPITFEGIFKNKGQTATVISFTRFLSIEKNDTLDMKFGMKPNNLKIPPGTDAIVNFVYEPIDLCDFKGHIQLQTNCSSEPKTIEFHFEVRKPNFLACPQSIISWGKIETGRIERPLFKVKNTGTNPLRFSVESVKYQQSFVEAASILNKSSENSSIGHPFRINPTEEDQFNITITSGEIQFNQISTSSLVELVEFNLQSLCDPVISIDGQLKNRSIKILVIGLQDEDLNQENQFKHLTDWNTLRIVPSKQIRHIATNINLYQPYSLLITMISAAYAANSSQIITLPQSEEDCESHVRKIHVESKTLISPLTVTDISGNVSSDKIKLLYTYCKSGVRNSEFYRHSTLLHHSFDYSHLQTSIRLRLYATINSTSNNDEAYTMQSYISIILSMYEKINRNDNLCCQALKTLEICIGKDPLMPKYIQPFIQYIRFVTTRTTNINDIEHLLADVLRSSKSSSVDLYHLLTSNSNDVKWALRFSCIPTKIKQILISLIEKQDNFDSSLISCHLIVASFHKYSIWQKSLLRGLQWIGKPWHDVNQDDKLTLLSAILPDQIQLVDLVTSFKTTDNDKQFFEG
ncbi:unnamed protein product [Rotaria sp. Silwood1]|nr:unnamed protein product [Rotaria sp. Silwood1]